MLLTHGNQAINPIKSSLFDQIPSYNVSRHFLFNILKNIFIFLLKKTSIKLLIIYLPWSCILV